MTLKKVFNQKNSSEPIIVDFGVRKISKQNFSFLVVLPRTALENAGMISRVNVKLIQFNGEKVIQLSRVDEKGGDKTE